MSGRPHNEQRSLFQASDPVDRAPPPAYDPPKYPAGAVQVGEKWRFKGGEILEIARVRPEMQCAMLGKSPHEACMALTREGRPVYGEYWRRA